MVVGVKDWVKGSRWHTLRRTGSRIGCQSKGLGIEFRWREGLVQGFDVRVKDSEGVPF